jgi:hypothetical protein
MEKIDESSVGAVSVLFWKDSVTDVRNAVHTGA